MKYLLVGLGNPGPEYTHTRHNIGFEVTDAFVQKHGGRFVPDRLANLAEVRYRGRIFICIQPTTYMNLSGRAVKFWADRERVPPENILVVVDDLALPLNKIRLRPGGSDAGHNGLKSIQEALGTTEYPKLRFGIGNDFPTGRQSDFVLGRWKGEEEPVVRAKIERCVAVIEQFSTAGITAAMNDANRADIGLDK